MQSWENNQKIVEKSMFCVFRKILTLDGDYYKSEICKLQYSNVPGIIWKNCPAKIWKIWHLSCFFFPTFLPVPT